MPETPEVRIEPIPEYGEVRVPLDLLLRDGRFDFTANRDLFELRFRDNEVVIKAGHYVGHIAVNDRLVLRVNPKLPIERLDRILRLSDTVPIVASQLVRGYALAPQSLPNLLDIVTDEFLSRLEHVDSNGLLRRYERRETDTAFPRGRFLLGQTMVRHQARGRLRAAVSYFEHTLDNAPNRCLKLALWQLVALLLDRGPAKGWRLRIARLNRASVMFDAVHLDLGRSFLRDDEVKEPSLLPESRPEYRGAVELAKSVVEGRGIDLDRPGAEIHLPSILVDLQDAFERYLRNALRGRMAEQIGGISVLDGNLKPPVGARKRLFSTGSSVDATPDILVERDRYREPIVVLEIKYIDRDFVRDEINQAIAYAVSYKAPCVLIRPKLVGEAPGLGVHGQVNGMTIYRYLYDLQDHLDRQEVRLARAVRAFARGEVDTFMAAA